MTTSSSNSSGGVGFFGLLFIIFLVLKLTDALSWSWWWISAPLWGPVALCIATFFGILALAGCGFINRPTNIGRVKH